MPGTGKGETRITRRSTEAVSDKAAGVEEGGQRKKVIALSSVPAVSDAPKSKGGRPRAGTELTPTHLRTIDAFIETPNKAEIARKLGISESQVARIFKLPIVRTELLRRTEELRRSLEIHMRAAGPKAFDTLLALLDDPHPLIRLRSATYIVDRLLSLPELAEHSEADAALEARIAEVTRRLDAGEQPNA
jgi:hypothetical protein